MVLIHGCVVMVTCQRLINIERCDSVVHKGDEIMHFSERSDALMHYFIAPFTCWHYNLAQFYRPGYVMVKIRWDELSHMGLDIHKVVLLWYLVNGIINIEHCDRVMHKCRWKNAFQRSANA